MHMTPQEKCRIDLHCLHVQTTHVDREKGEESTTMIASSRLDLFSLGYRVRQLAVLRERGHGVETICWNCLFLN